MLSVTPDAVGGLEGSPDTAPAGGGIPKLINRRANERGSRCLLDAHSFAWPDDGSLSLLDTTHREAGFFACDTVNPNAGGAHEWVNNLGREDHCRPICSHRHHASHLVGGAPIGIATISCSGCGTKTWHGSEIRLMILIIQ